MFHLLAFIRTLLQGFVPAGRTTFPFVNHQKAWDDLLLPCVLLPTKRCATISCLGCTHMHQLAMSLYPEAQTEQGFCNG